MSIGKLLFKLHGQRLAGLWELMRISKPEDGPRGRDGHQCVACGVDVLGGQACSDVSWGPAEQCSPVASLERIRSIREASGQLGSRGDTQMPGQHTRRPDCVGAQNIQPPGL